MGERESGCTFFPIERPTHPSIGRFSNGQLTARTRIFKFWQAATSQSWICRSRRQRARLPAWLLADCAKLPSNPWRDAGSPGGLDQIGVARLTGMLIRG